MSKKRAVGRLVKLEHYCYLRWLKAVSREAQLFWINKHLYLADLLLEKKEDKL